MNALIKWRQRGASKQSEQGGEGNEPYSEQSGTAQQRDQQHTAEAESAEQTCKEQRGVEPTQDEGEGAYRTQQRDEEEEQSGSSKRKRGKQKMDPHQQSQWDERQKAATAPASSDEEDGAMQQSRKQQREYGEDHDRQPRSHGEARTSPTAPANSTHELIGGVENLSGGVAVKESVFLRRNPPRRARPGGNEKEKKPARKQATKRPVWKGTYMAKTQAKGGALKYMIRLGRRTIERMENTYEATRPPKRGHER